MQATVMLQQSLNWPVLKREWAALLERHDQEQTAFLRGIAGSGASQQEISRELGISRRRLGQLLDYESTRQKLGTGVPRSEPPTERELRPYIEQAAAEVATDRGVERVRRNREEVHERAAKAYENEEKPVARKSPNLEEAINLRLDGVINRDQGAKMTGMGRTSFEQEVAKEQVRREILAQPVKVEPAYCEHEYVTVCKHCGEEG